MLFAVSAGMVGFGGLFAMYSYIAPIVTKTMDRPESWIAVFTLAFGIGSVAGSWGAGILADWNVERSVLWGFVATALVLVAFYFAVMQPCRPCCWCSQSVRSVRSSRSTCRSG
ncbi:hypothetical protein [Aeromicrobium sp. UC242_57]|uniref:hypothetical protein n=1 Tax=Aeromicrobium sp. UC242_57 TaxID=3374624 RepID=UPI0037C01527